MSQRLDLVILRRTSVFVGFLLLTDATMYPAPGQPSYCEGDATSESRINPFFFFFFLG